MKNILSLFVVLSCLCAFNASAAIDAKIQDSLAWDIPNPGELSSNIVVLASQSVTDLNIGAGTNFIKGFNVAGNVTQTSLANIIPANQPVGNYNLFVKSLGTNGYFSAWSSNLSINFVKIPATPNNLRLLSMP